MTARNIIKQWFSNFKKPTQEQFWAWIDSFWHKDDKIPISSVENLETFLQNTTTSDQFSNHLSDTQAHQSLFETKVDKEQGKGLSTEDFTTELKQKLEDVENNYLQKGTYQGTASDLKNQIENLTMGDRNFILNSKNPRRKRGYFLEYDLSQALEPGEYTASFDAEIIEDVGFLAVIPARKGRDTPYSHISQPTKGNGRYSFKVSINTNDINAFSLYAQDGYADHTGVMGEAIFSNVSLKKGNNKDWTPAPEDTISAINQAKISVEQKVESLTIGGRNLLKNTANPQQGNWFFGNCEVSFNQADVFGNNNAIKIRNFRSTDVYFADSSNINDFRKYGAGEYIFSGYFKCNRPTYNLPLHFNHTLIKKQVQITNQWQKISIPFRIQTIGDYAMFHIGGWRTMIDFSNLEIDFCYLKIEKGNKPTDWMPALEDLPLPEFKKGILISSNRYDFLSSNSGKTHFVMNPCVIDLSQLEDLESVTFKKCYNEMNSTRFEARGRTLIVRDNIQTHSSSDLNGLEGSYAKVSRVGQKIYINLMIYLPQHLLSSFVDGNAGSFNGVTSQPVRG